MAKYLDPKNDLTFKRIFGEHPDLLISFLNEIMPFESGRLIEEVNYLPAEQVPNNPGKKNSLVDVKCTDNYKRQFIVEMQMLWDEAFYNRIVFNAGKAYVKQLNRKDKYHLLQPVYTLAILNENFDYKTESFYHRFQIVNLENPNEIIPGLEFILVELTKLQPQTWSDRKLAVLWLRFLNEVGEDMKNLPSEMEANKFIRKAAELCEEGAFTPEELAAYDAYWDIVRTEKTLREGAWQEGETIGLEKGEAIGLEKGEAIGRAAERTEVQENIVINSYQAGLSIETISNITGLTSEKITEFLKKHDLY